MHKHKRALKLLLLLPPLVLALLYGGGYVAQFLDNYKRWQEILGNSDVSLFLGCVDKLTASYISERSGEISVHVESKAKQLGTWRISNYTLEYRETTGVGKRLSPSKASAHIPQWQKTKPPEPVETPIVETQPQRKKRTASTVVPADKDSILS